MLPPPSAASTWHTVDASLTVDGDGVLGVSALDVPGPAVITVTGDVQEEVTLDTLHPPANDDD